jgi:glutamyl-tRNA synthetase
VPYFQIQRGEIYKKYLEKLRSTGRVYEKDNALWFKVSGEVQTIHDAVRGDVRRKEEKDFVIVRSDVRLIDAQMTHVIRGEDHLSNSSKHE